MIPERAVVVQGTRMQGVPGRRVRAAVRADPAHLAEGEGHDKLKLNAILREHGIVS